MKDALDGHFVALMQIQTTPTSLSDLYFDDATRPHQVAHFWNVEPDGEYGHLRNQVTLAVRRVLDAHPSWTGTAGLISTRGRIGRRTINSTYVESLATHKIIVVCQRDEWEDHLRLWEGLISGALVLSDPMTHMPVGLQQNVHLGIYESISELERQIEYYLSPEGTPSRLAMARAGYQAALTHHMGWQRYDRLIAGHWPSDRFHAVIPALSENPP
jgi:Glycosyl transferases group 1